MAILASFHWKTCDALLESQNIDMSNVEKALIVMHVKESHKAYILGKALMAIDYHGMYNFLCEP
jgi:hypothetical protein